MIMILGVRIENRDVQTKLHTGFSHDTYRCSSNDEYGKYAVNTQVLVCSTCLFRPIKNARG